MLVLTRKVNESIIIGDDIEITVVEIKGDHVKLGITAPRNITVHRKEVYLAIQRENIVAAKSEVDKLSEIGKIMDDKKDKGR